MLGAFRFICCSFSFFTCCYFISACGCLLGFSSGLGSLNYLSTSKHQRHLGLSLLSMSLFVWSIIVTSVLLVGALPILGVAVTGLLLDRNIATWGCLLYH